MVDRFIEEVANLAGRTSKALDKVASELDKSEYPTQIGLLNAVAKSNRALSQRCATVTQPIEIDRYNLTQRLKRIMDESQDVAADLLSRSKPGHNKLSEIADLIKEVIELQDG